MRLEFRLDEKTPTGLKRHFGLIHATALNVTQVVGAGVFITIPLMLLKLPGPYALLGWLAAGVLMLMDSLIWGELGATFPGSGGSYLYLLECYGRERWGRLMAFLFIWQFLISGPLEIGSGLIAISTFSNAISPEFHSFNEHWTWTWQISRAANLSIEIGPSHLLALGIGMIIVALLYRRITILGKLTLTFWLGVLLTIGWILLEGGLRFNPARAFDFGDRGWQLPDNFASALGATMVLAMYSYLGYYNVCYIGDEVRDPGRTIPRSILLTAITVCLLFVGLHLAMLGTVSWTDVPTSEEAQATYNLPAEFMRHIHGDRAATLVTLCLIWSCIGSVFAGILGYSRIPYGAARYGHFFSAFERVHPDHQIPHISLLLIGGLSLMWSFFSFQSVIDALIVTRILEQFIGQIIGVMLLRNREPDRPRPFKIWLYPLPCFLALAGWIYMYATAQPAYIALGLATLFVGSIVFLVWTRRTGAWPFGTAGYGEKERPDK
jgi:amino acid transporter